MSEPRPALFPACVTLPDGQVHHPVRIATDQSGVTRAFAWDYPTGDGLLVGTWPAVDLQRADDATLGPPKAYTAPDGAHIEGRRNVGCNLGCGCSHPLKTWRPSLSPAGA